MRIYVASSWRNERLDEVFAALRARGHSCYDFRHDNPPANFNWAMIDPTWDASNPVLSARDQQRALCSPVAARAFDNDNGGLQWADTGVLVLPCGKSAHLEAGYLLAQGKPVHVLLADGDRPELMHLLAGMLNIHATIDELVVGLEPCPHEEDLSDCTCPCPFDTTHASKDCTCAFEVSPTYRGILLGAM